MAVRLVLFVGFVLGLAAVAGCAPVQQAPDPKQASELETVQQAAKTAAEFEFLGTLARTCFLPPTKYRLSKTFAGSANHDARGGALAGSDT